MKRYQTTLNIAGRFFISLGLIMLVPLFISMFYRHSDVNAFLYASLITVSIGLALVTFFKTTYQLRIQDGFVLVGLIWVGAGFFGSLPFYFSDATTNMADALFESVSGFTTTGATILTSIETQSNGILLWRSLTHWLGGMGIIVLSVAFLPRMGAGAMQLFRAEVPGPTAERLLPRIQETAKVLWGIYVALTGIQTVLLKIAGMTWFEAVNHAFATMATGGYSTRDLSIAGFNSLWIELIVIVFMFAAGVNFTLYYYAANRRWHMLREDRELRFYIAVLLVCSGLLVLNLTFSRTFVSLAESLRHGVFQAISITTTTGFTTTDFEQWPPFSRGLIMVLKFLGGSAGSTGGALKQIRILIIIKLVAREFYKMLHPRAVRPIRLGTKVIPDELLHSIAAFTLLYMVIFVITGLAVAAMGVDIVSAFSASAATIGNIGPGLGLVGPLENYSVLPSAAKLLLSLAMLLGRLEIYTLLIFMAIPIAGLLKKW